PSESIHNELEKDEAVAKIIKDVEEQKTIRHLLSFFAAVRVNLEEEQAFIGEEYHIQASIAQKQDKTDELISFDIFLHASKNVDIRILSIENGKYQGFIQTRWFGPLQFFVEPSQADIQEINIELQKKIEEISVETDIIDGFNGSLSDMADSGRYFFAKIFTER